MALEFEIGVDKLGEEKINQMLNAFDAETVKKVIKVAARSGIHEVTKEARKNLKGKINPSQSMLNAISTSTVEDGTVLGASSRALKKSKYADSYKLLFFERGTKPRYTKKTKAYRGQIQPTHFFEDAVSSKGNAAIEKFKQSVDNYINKIQNK